MWEYRLLYLEELNGVFEISQRFSGETKDVVFASNNCFFEIGEIFPNEIYDFSIAFAMGEDFADVNFVADSGIKFASV